MRGPRAPARPVRRRLAREGRRFRAAGHARTRVLALPPALPRVSSLLSLAIDPHSPLPPFHPSLSRFSLVRKHVLSLPPPPTLPPMTDPALIS